MIRLARSILVVFGLAISACAAPAPSASPSIPPDPTAAEASQAPPPPHSTGACALTVKQVHVPQDMNPELEVATTLNPPPLGTPYRVRMTEDRAGTPAAFVNTFGEDWDGSIHVVETGPGGTVNEHTLGRRMEGHGWGTAFTEAGMHVIELSSPHNGCAATLVFEVAE